MSHLPPLRNRCLPPELVLSLSLPRLFLYPFPLFDGDPPFFLGWRPLPVKIFFSLTRLLIVPLPLRQLAPATPLSFRDPKIMAGMIPLSFERGRSPWNLLVLMGPRIYGVYDRCLPPHLEPLSSLRWIQRNFLPLLLCSPSAPLLLFPRWPFPCKRIVPRRPFFFAATPLKAQSLRLSSFSAMRLPPSETANLPFRLHHPPFFHDDPTPSA